MGDINIGNKTTKVVSGFPVLGLLGIAFIVLKLVGVIDWSWWWVLAPFWAGPVLFIGLFMLFLGAAAILAAIFG